MKGARPSAPADSRQGRSPARPTRLGLRRPAGTRPRWRRVREVRNKLDLTQVGTLLAALATLALTIPSLYTAQTQARNAENGQLTDRFSKAIEQLGSDKLQIRLGGIYALERIAGDSERDYSTVVDVLATFVREETKVLRPPQGGPCADRSPTADVQAALTVLGQPGPPEGDLHGSLDFSRACLRHADLSPAVLTFANFTEADLTAADFTNADLSMADFAGADLTTANLTRADLSLTDFTGANLSKAKLK